MSADRPSYDVTTASLLASSEASFSFPTCFTRLTHASTVPALTHPLDWACPLSARLQSLFCRFNSLVLIGISTSLRVFLRLLSPVLIFSELQANIPLTLGHLRRHSYQHQRQFHHPSPAFCPCILFHSRASFHRWRWFPTLSRDWSPGYVTKRSPPHLTVVFCQDTFFSLARP